MRSLIGCGASGAYALGPDEEGEAEPVNQESFYLSCDWYNLSPDFFHTFSYSCRLRLIYGFHQLIVGGFFFLFLCSAHFIRYVRF
jgi:hypothetical protein